VILAAPVFHVRPKGNPGGSCSSRLAATLPPCRGLNIFIMKGGNHP
jgi:hypothetical protein